MKNKVIATAILVVVGFMILAPAASAQVFYFNSKTGAFQSIYTKNSVQERFYSILDRNENNSNSIFYCWPKYNKNTDQPAPPVQPEEPAQPVQPAEPIQPKEPAQPVQPAPSTPKPAPQEPKVEDTDTGTNNIVNAEELKMLEYINQERGKAGVSPLKMDTEVARVAQIKSQDMVDKNYFSHTSPTYGSPFDMMRNFGITYRTAGENIAKNSTMLNAHTALMNSEGHRQNILNPNYTHIGIGIVQNNSQSGITVTQMFIGK